MVLLAFNSNVLLSAPLELGLSDKVVIGNLGFVYSEGSIFASTSGRNLVSVSGSIASGGTAFSMSGVDPFEGQCNVLVTSTGLISASYGIESIGPSLSVSNAGAFHADLSAIRLEGGSGFATHSVINSGTMSAGIAIRGEASLLSNLYVVNSGEITGTGGWAILLADASAAADVVINNGLFNGNVSLGGGADLYDARGGGLVLGGIGGGLGNDRFRPGSAEENFEGGSGSDLLDFRGGGGAVEIALDGAWDASGWAEGDIFAGLERITGTRFADRIGGDAGANVLSGMAGDDALVGQAGGDILAGGAGADSLTGGAGSDTFQFQRLGDCGDRISDFSSAAAGNDDRFQISASGFGGGLAAGALSAGRFRIRADNAAQDIDDRFIFRTTDRSLWFDVDGTGEVAAILVASLQAGAAMTAGDIALI